MARYTPAAFEEQDRLLEGFVRTAGGSYLPIGRCSYQLKPDAVEITSDDNPDFSGSSWQDELTRGYIRMTNGAYHHFSSIEYIEQDNDDCFVATAVYGNPHAPQVEALRRFRDDTLKQSPLGNLFVGLYYSGAGKSAADFIREHVPSIIPTIRVGLDALVARIEAQQARN